MAKILTPKRERFAQECAAGKHASDAYRAAFNTSGMSSNSIWTNASKIYKDAKVVQRIEELRSVSAAEVMVDAKWVLAQWVAIARADPAEIVRLERHNCRHCHGMNHAYRWRDDEEFWAALAAVSEANETARKPKPLPTDEGGYGFRKLAPPDPACPKCEGRGIEDAYIADVRTMTGDSRRLYAGLKQTKDGLQVLLRSQDAALVNIARYLGMLTDKVQHSGLVGIAPVPDLTDEQRAILKKAISHDI